MKNPLLTNIIKQSIWYDKGSYNEYEFIIGKLYRLKHPRYYSSNLKEITFFKFEEIYSLEYGPKQQQLDPGVANIEIEKSAMIYIGHFKTNLFKNVDLKNKGFLNKTIPCFYTKNIFVFPEQIVANNPQTFFKLM